MILVGSQRGGAGDLARHLLKEENEHVLVHEVRGFAAEDLHGAFKEVEATARGTQCQKFLFSLSLNAPPGERATTEDYEQAISKVEAKLGLANQPRAIVFHEKDGRRHCHAVWSRIDGQEMKAIPLSYSKLKLQEVSRELFLQHEWTMPRGLLHSRDRDPRNLTLAEWQQAKRTGQDPREVKALIQDCWTASDNRQSLQAALREQGLRLARGERRGHVVIDRQGETYALARWAGVKTKEVKAKIGAPSLLPAIEDARADLARDEVTGLEKLRREQAKRTKALHDKLQTEKRAQIEKHRQERDAFNAKLRQRSEGEARERQARLRTGMRGWLDRLTGQRTKTIKQNEMEALKALQRDRHLSDEFAFRQIEARRQTEQRHKAALDRVRNLGGEIGKDRKQAVRASQRPGQSQTHEQQASNRSKLAEIRERKAEQVQSKTIRRKRGPTITH